MNKNARLILGPETRKRDSLRRKCILCLNVDQEIETMTELLKYFDDWIDWCRSQKDNLGHYEVKRCDQLGISTITLKNMKTSIFGFLNLTKEILTQHETQGLNFVPFCTTIPEH